MNNLEAVSIIGTGLYTPSESVSNAELVHAFNSYVQQFNSTHAAEIASGELHALDESSTEFIEKASGIHSRYVMNREGIVDPDRMCPQLPDRNNDEHSIQCEMAIAAAHEAMAQAGISASEIDAVIVACSNLQRAYPAVAVEVQAALGIDGYAFDMNVACSSATFGIQTGVDAIRNNSARTVLMVNPEICSGHLNFRDRDSHFIFGDACTAVILRAGDSAGYRILGSRLKTVYSNNIRNNFGFLNRGDESGVGATDKLFVQNGRKVFKEVCPMVAEQIVQHLSDLGISNEACKRMWLHQANLSMNQLVSKRVLGREATAEEAPVILDRYANTSSAGSIIAFHLHNEDLKSGEVGVICSFGAGYSVGSVIVQKN
ncbi:MAG: beta-ketoacyl-ACP synthase III [Pseudomonadales bacterium]